MMTRFEDFKKDNGLPVTVEYSFSAGSETTYSPMSGACGGDPCEVSILSSWPDTDQFENLCETRNAFGGRGWLDRICWLLLTIPVRFHEWRARLTDAERERMEEWLIEHADVDEPDYEEDYR